MQDPKIFDSVLHMSEEEFSRRQKEREQRRREIEKQLNRPKQDEQ